MKFGAKLKVGVELDEDAAELLREYLELESGDPTITALIRTLAAMSAAGKPWTADAEEPTAGGAESQDEAEEAEGDEPEAHSPKTEPKRRGPRRMPGDPAPSTEL